MTSFTRQECDNGRDVIRLSEPLHRVLLRNRVDHMLAFAFPEQRRVDGAWGDGVHCDALASQVFGQDTRDLLDGTLRRKVAEGVWEDS